MSGARSLSTFPGMEMLKEPTSSHSQNPSSLMLQLLTCLLYTSDAADEEDSVDLGGRRIIKKKKKVNQRDSLENKRQNKQKEVDKEIVQNGREMRNVYKV
eukprot:TRINITY_DN14061_c0_g1_i1.p2 TRINITY_DN14061_c0_g1~~TRINITY_DN14061_c0_g1_i1.p2  ORF type:complete len:100 (+),score=21.12 TRINITY_DN14061_c0_g1_i1:811-1110(+)